MESKYFYAMFQLLEKFADYFKAIFYSFRDNWIEFWGDSPSASILLDFVENIPFFGDILDYSLFDFAFFICIGIILASIVLWFKNVFLP